MAIDAADARDPQDPFGLKRLKDPEFEASERERLTHITEGPPTPEVQKAFAKWVNYVRNINNDPSDYNIQPQNLFYSTTKSFEFMNEKHRVCERFQYKPPMGGAFNGLDVLAELSFHVRDTSTKASINKFGETPNYDANFQSNQLKILFETFAKQTKYEHEQDSIEISSDLGPRKLYIKYIQDNIYSVYIKSHKDYFELDSSRFDEILKSGQAIIHKDGKVYEIEYNKDSEMITLKKSVQGEIEDIVVFPRHQNQKEKFEEAFPPEFLDDIYGADTEMDKTWKGVTLDTFGISWDKPTPNPTS